MDSPEKINVPIGKVAWCTCGKSANQPYCDGSHKSTGNVPIVEIVNVPMDKYICRCGKTTNAPFCDGSHKTKANE